MTAVQTVHGLNQQGIGRPNIKIIGIFKIINHSLNKKLAHIVQQTGKEGLMRQSVQTAFFSQPV